MTLFHRIEQGLDALIPIPQSIVFWGLLAAVGWMLVLLHLPKFRLTVFG